MTTFNRFSLLLVVALLSLAIVTVTNAQGPVPLGPRAGLGTGITYQGQLKSGGSAYSGTCDFEFGLYDDPIAGTQIGTTQPAPGVMVSSGLFTTWIDFGAAAFNGEARWLAIGVRCPAGSGSYTALSARQALTAAPYALYATNAAALQGRMVASTAPSGGQVLKYDGAQWAPAADGVSYENVLVVAKSGGNYTTISAALSAIADNSATQRYLIWVAPGTYTEHVTMKPYVDIEGAGELATKITYTGSSASTDGTVVSASDAELRFLTVENTGGGAYATAIFNNSTSPRLTHVTATSSGGTLNNTGVLSSNASPTMTNVNASASGGAAVSSFGIANLSSSPTIYNSVIAATGGGSNRGIYNSGTSGPYTVTVDSSLIKGSGNTISNAPGFTTRVGASKLDGGAISGAGVTCAGVYDENYVFYASSCP